MKKREVARQEEYQTGCGKLKCIQHDDGQIALSLGRNGSCAYAYAAALRTTLNEIVQLGGDLKKMARKLEGTDCFKSNCCVDLIGAFIKGEANEIHPPQP